MDDPRHHDISNENGLARRKCDNRKNQVHLVIAYFHWCAIRGFSEVRVLIKVMSEAKRHGKMELKEGYNQ